MTEEQKRQSAAGGESPLEFLLAQANVRTLDELAALISHISGQPISGATLRRRNKDGKRGWAELSMTKAQWDALCQLTKLDWKDLPPSSD